jgi:hypothetical protein
LTTIRHNIEREKRYLASQLRAIGDKKLVDQDQIAEQFLDELLRHIKEAEVNGTVTLANTFRSLGVADVDLARPISVDQLGDTYVWKTQSEVLARIADVPAGLVQALRRSEVPSLYLRDDVAALRRRGSRRAEGGDSDDESFLCLSLYARLTTVDKRTAEYVRQIRRRSPELDDIMGEVIRLPSLEALERSMPLWFHGSEHSPACTV